MTVSPASPAELAEAFALLYGPGEQTNIGHAFRMIARGELDPGNVLIARRDGAVVGAVFAERVPGGVAVLWPARAVANEAAVEDALMVAAMEHVAGARVVQAFLPPEHVERAGPLLRAGFRHVTRVWQMERGLLPSPPEAGGEGSKPPSWLTAIPYADCDPATFHATLLRAHDDSLDCPELNQVVGGEDLLAGYREAVPDPDGWWLAVADDQPAGVLLLNGAELTFLGVVPEHRGHGIGRQLLALAMQQAPGLALIVDARNIPAIQLYWSAGMAVVGAREVYLHFPAPAADTTGTTGRRA